MLLTSSPLLLHLADKLMRTTVAFYSTPLMVFRRALIFPNTPYLVLIPEVRFELTMRATLPVILPLNYSGKSCRLVGNGRFRTLHP